MSCLLDSTGIKVIQNLQPSLWYNSEYINGLDNPNPTFNSEIPELFNIVDTNAGKATNVGCYQDNIKTIPSTHPIFKENGVNGKPYIHFNGNGNFLYIPGTEVTKLWVNDVSVFWFFTNPFSTNNYQYSISFGFTGNLPGQSMINTNGSFVSYPNTGTNTEIINFANPTRLSSREIIFGGITKKVGVEMLQYNTLLQPNYIHQKLTMNTPTIAKYDISLGGRFNNFWNDNKAGIKLYELIIFPKALNHTEAINVLTYLKMKYNQ
ncbi:hypothetical protein [Pedobacter sp. UBA4863]|uniref:hypothetical protein n=1 Tax=Pedobacter sp. UBA4863 TaxID=1947060 RepID=UPI0025FCC182|nr:hypothetical protein [Pedobacter sp. UBA4863]